MNLEQMIISKSKLMVDPIETNAELAQVITIYDALVIAREYAEAMCKRQLALAVRNCEQELTFETEEIVSELKWEELKKVIETTPLATEEK